MAHWYTPAELAAQQLERERRGRKAICAGCGDTNRGDAVDRMKHGLCQSCYDAQQQRSLIMQDRSPNFRRSMAWGAGGRTAPPLPPTVPVNGTLSHDGEDGPQQG